jgi:predicted transcriptional regulator
MKSVLISIQPKWCELIANGSKTIEVRKTKPKLETPFKVYIYETKGRTEIPTFIDEDGHEIYQGRGQVIGEFVCDSINYVRNYGDCVDMYDCYASCLSANEIIEYAKDKNGNFVYTYGWHISNLVIYDKPRDITEFVTEGDCSCENCNKCKWLERGNGYNVENDCLLPYTNSFKKAIKPLFRPPQSWCYVESE